jgi:EAL domain-containing protein (putative c-di-GMP-specific phosphodiesterase class I)
VAEGVGDQATLGMLARMGCDHAQGYLFAPALNAEQLGVWLQDNTTQGRMLATKNPAQ